jgi:hypothetical protein
VGGILSAAAPAIASILLAWMGAAAAAAEPAVLSIPAVETGVGLPVEIPVVADLPFPIWIFQALFAAGGEFPCAEAADADDSGRVNIADGVYLLDFLFQPGGGSGDGLYPAPPAPFPGCGLDPTPDALGCATPPACE